MAEFIRSRNKIFGKTSGGVVTAIQVTSTGALVISTNFKGYYATEAALNAAHPTGQNGWYAIVGSTDTVWIWDGDTSAWVDSGVSGAVTSVFGRTGVVTAQANDYTWAQIDKTTSSIADITTKNHGDLTLNDGTNPHSTTKTDVGLGNVPNTDCTDADNISDGSTNAIITLTQETNFGTAYTHANGSTGADHTYIDQDVTSGSAPTFTADNLSDGGGNAIITTTQETNFETAYTHSQDNTQAHSDYLLNNANDTTSGTITTIGKNNTSQALTDGATISIDLSNGYDGTVTVAGDRNVSIPTNLATGASGTWTFTCDGTARTITWNSANYRLNGSGTPSTAFAASSINKIYWHSPDGTNVDLSIGYGV